MSSEPHTPLSLVKLTQSYFTGKGLASPRVDAEILLAHVLGCKRLDLYLRHDEPLLDEQVARFREFVRRRAAGEPVQHLTGEQEFYALTLQVGKGALIPRPETEILVETIFKTVAPEGDGRPWRVCELGTGTGAIAIALAKGWPKATVQAVDLSFDALETAKGNVAYHSLAERVKLLQGDLFEPVHDLGEAFDLVVSNPPYVSASELPDLDPEVRDYEPRLALDGGTDGLDVIRAIARQAPSYLKVGGWLFLEIGGSQGEAVQQLLQRAGVYEEVRILQDLAGRPRVAGARKPPASL
ncbi:MAG: peptide chain release factor N(5)-glutamine methyltransferase [Myxococcales bacterium]|nr:MAG: peptide chain release factor N(5)-glutamine methyltransferase [Myxococcales bacterium]